MKYYSKLHGLFSYFSACGMTFVLIIAGTFVPMVAGMLSATTAHPVAAISWIVCYIVQFNDSGKDGTLEFKFWLTILGCPNINLSLEVLTEPVLLK